MASDQRDVLIYEREPNFDARLAAATVPLVAQGRVVLCSGCFDLLHAGHQIFLDAAAEVGDSLVVALNSDASVRELKGPERPIVTEEHRSRALLALPTVDLVVVCEGRDARSVLRTLRPNIFVIGPDSEQSYPEEAAIARQVGAEVMVVERQGDLSTTLIVESFRDRGVQEVQPNGGTDASG